MQSKQAGLPPWVSRRLITVDDYYKMAEIGILSPQDRVELIEGQIIEMSPIGSGHAGPVNRLNRLLITGLGDRGVLSVQNPVRLSFMSEPEPDLAVLRPRLDDYTSSHPTAEDVLLLIEVSDISLAYDRSVKAELYARHAIPEFWIVNLRDRLVTVHRSPESGCYTVVTQILLQGTQTIETLPGLELRAEDLFPE